MDSQICKFPEGPYQYNLQDGRLLVLTILKIQRSEGAPDGTMPCGVEEKIKKGESNPNVLDAAVCLRCNQAFNIIAAVYPANTFTNEEKSD